MSSTETNPLPLSASGRWWNRVQTWAAPPAGLELGRAASLWANPGWSLFCLFALVATLVLPAEGLGFRWCLMHVFLGVDCPACGMTRGVSHLWRGHLATSISYNAFAPVAFLYLWIQSSYLFLGPGLRTRTIRLLNAYDRLFWWGWLAGFGMFLMYGLSRAGLQIWQHISNGEWL
jgi:hypothetical protein